MKIQDLEMMEILTIEQQSIEKVQGGIGLSFLGNLIGIRDLQVLSWNSLHEKLDNGLGSVSALNVVMRTSDYYISLASSNATISIV